MSDAKTKTVVGQHPPHVKVQAREMYLYTKLTLKEIADRSGVPAGTVRDWYFKDKWPEERRKLERDLQERSDYEAAKIIRENRNKVMNRHLTVGEKIENHVEKIIDKAVEDKKNLKPDQVLDVAKAFQASGNISGKVVGIGDKASGSGGGPAVNVLVNTNFTPTPVHPDHQGPQPGPPPIDIEPESVDPHTEPEDASDEEPF